ncbi:MAG TPA: hypothetical protein VJ783_17970 [Pirellulales bacterium]|nr:hypothetical protein [Pirellulales bacterium]
MKVIASAAKSSPSAAPPDSQNHARARMLIAAAVALAGCRLLGAWHSIVGTSAAGVVMVALAIGIVSVSPRLRRVLFFLALPLAVLANAAMLGRGSILAWMGTQGLLEDGLLAMNLPWTPLFWCVPIAAAVNLWAFAKPSGSGFRNQRGGAMVANAMISLLAVYWMIHGAQLYRTGSPPLGALLPLAVAAISFAVLVWDAPPPDLGTTPGRRSAPWRIAFVTAVSLAIVTAILVASAPVYRQRKTITELESFGFRLMPGWVSHLELPPGASIDADESERLGQLLTRLPELSSLSISNLRPGAGRLLRPLAGRRLTHLELIGPGVTDETLADLAALPALAYLNISQSNITDAGLADLAKLPGLQTLDLSDTTISGEGLSKLASLPRLWGVELRNVPLDDGDLSALKQFPAIRHLNLRGTRVTDDGIERLRAALPLPVIINGVLGPAMPGIAPAAPAPNPAPPTAEPSPSAAESPHEPPPGDAESPNDEGC